MSYQDPGEQSTRRSRRRSTPPAAASGQGDLLAPPPAPSGRQQGEARKAKALAQHESGHEDRLGYIRERLKELYAQRDRTRRDDYARLGRREGGPLAPAYVTADDAAKILAQAGNMGYTDEAERRNWFGTLFREKGWRVVEPGWVPSLRPEMNGRVQRTWAWKP